MTQKNQLTFVAILVDKNWWIHVYWRRIPTNSILGSVPSKSELNVCILFQTVDFFKRIPFYPLKNIRQVLQSEIIDGDKYQWKFKPGESVLPSNLPFMKN